jgi:hypothetical protein
MRLDAIDMQRSFEASTLPYRDKEDAQRVIDSYAQMGRDIMEVISPEEDYSDIQKLKELL